MSNHHDINASRRLSCSRMSSAQRKTDRDGSDGPPFRLIFTSNQEDAFGEASSQLIHNLHEHEWSVSGVLGRSSLSDLFAQI